MTFAELWDTKVKQLAQACIQEQQFVELARKEEGYIPTVDEQAYLNEVQVKYKDLYGMYYISNMCWHIEHALFDGRIPAAKVAIINIVTTLDSPSYFHNVFGGNPDDEEWKTRDALRKGLHELLDTPN